MDFLNLQGNKAETLTIKNRSWGHPPILCKETTDRPEGLRMLSGNRFYFWDEK